MQQKLRSEIDFVIYLPETKKKFRRARKMLVKIFVSVNFKLCRLIFKWNLDGNDFDFFPSWIFVDQILCLMFAVSLAGIIHDSEPLESETDHHHKIDHEHATSHQSFKIHHFHAVPVYVKHEDQQYLKNPIEVGGVKHKLKVKNRWIKSVSGVFSTHFISIKRYFIRRPSTAIRMD